LHQTDDTFTIMMITGLESRVEVRPRAGHPAGGSAKRQRKYLRSRPNRVWPLCQRLEQNPRETGEAAVYPGLMGQGLDGKDTSGLLLPRPDLFHGVVEAGAGVEDLVEAEAVEDVADGGWGLGEDDVAGVFLGVVGGGDEHGDGRGGDHFDAGEVDDDAG